MSRVNPKRSWDIHGSSALWRSSGFYFRMGEPPPFHLMTNEEFIRLKKAGKIEEIVANFVRAAYKLAHRYHLPEVFPDLAQEGVCGIFEAIEKFDPAKGKFSKYVFYWIHARQSTYMKKFRRFGITSLDAPVDNDGENSKTFEDYLADLKNMPGEGITSPERESLRKALMNLKDKERGALLMYYGCKEEDKVYYQDIARKLKITRAGARQLVLRSLAKVKKDMNFRLFTKRVAA